MRVYVGFLLILFFPVLLRAQGGIGGRVVCEGKGLNLATITISANGHPIATLLSDTSGSFFGEVPDGDYQLDISLVGYKPYHKDVQSPSSALNILLERDEKIMRTVTVQAAKPLVERRLDRIIFNVQNSIIASGGTAWEALARTPGVRTGFDGGITANGKGAVVYMDNRQLRLSGEDLAAFLRGLNAENILRIEVIANPPASYDAQGGAVINIVTKKMLADGLNATLTGAYTQATYGSYRGGANFNYRSGKWNVYGNFSNNNAKKSYREDDYIIFASPQHYADWEGNKRGWRESNTVNYKLGIDYSPGKGQVIGLVMDGTNSSRNRLTSIYTDIYNSGSPTIDSFLNTVNHTRSSVDQYAFNFNYKGTLDTGGRKSLNIDIDYDPFSNRRNQDVFFAAYRPDGSKLPSFFSNNTQSLQDISIASAKADYEQKLTDSWAVESGGKWSRIINKSILDFYNLGGAAPTHDSALSNQFRYTEEILAFYVNSRRGFGKFSLETGLRAEYTWANGVSLTQHQNNERSYLQLFPTLFSSYTFNDKHEVNLYYGRRINRPDYWRLNPFKYYTSPYSYLEGNPDLRPAFVQEVELGYTFKKQYSINLFYHSTRNYFSNITVQDNVNHIYYDTQRNLDQSLEAGFYASAPYSPFKWWEINVFIQASYKKEKSGFLSSEYDYHTLFAYANVSQAFVLSQKKGWKAEVNAWYATPGIQGIYSLARSYDLSLGLRKSLWKSKGSLQLSVADLLYSNYYRIDVSYLNQRNGFVEKNDSRSVTLTFSYKFGRKKLDAARNRKTSSEDEKKRAQN